MYDYEDVGAYYADRDYYEREYPDKAERGQEKDIDFEDWEDII